MSNSRPAGVVVLAASLALSALAGNTLHVPAEYATIQAAVDEAESGDTVLVADGTYTGDGNRDIVFPGERAITVRSEGIPQNCIIDCEGRPDEPHSAFWLDGDTVLGVIDGFTVRNGFGSPYQEGGYGGAVHCAYSFVTIKNCVFEHNTAGRGGAIWAYLCPSLTLENCLFTENRATLFGGAFYPYYEDDPLFGEIKVKDCTFKGNTAPAGGAIQTVAVNATYTNCMFVDNTSTNPDDAAGAIRTFLSLESWTDCHFVRNRTAGRTSVLWIREGTGTLMNCSFVGNSAVHGGAMGISFNSSAIVSNCVFTGNEISGGQRPAAAFWIGDGLGGPSNASVVNCTFSNNVGPAGSGALATTQTSSAVVANCVFWDNAPTGIARKENSKVAVTYSDVEGGYSGTGNIKSDPLFTREPSPGDDGEWGTDDDDYGDLRLSAGSPCIDSANNEAVPADSLDLDGDGDFDEPLPFDFEGNSRFVDDPDTDDKGRGPAPIVDMGAYEYQGPPIHRGDVNCDSGVDFNDIDPFVTALISRDEYESQYPGCNYLNADIDQSGGVDFNDIDGFVACLINGECE